MNEQLVDIRAEQYAESKSKKINNVLENIVADTTQNLEYSDMLSGYQINSLLRILVSMQKPKIAVEVGMFTGFASHTIAESLPPSGKLICLEMNDRYIEIATRHLKDTNSFNKIEIIRGSARETVHNLPDSIDFVFLDADKENYPEYYTALVPKMSIGGILIADNVLWHGGIFATDPDRKALSIMELNELVYNDERMESVMLTVRDGITIARKVRN